VCAAVQIGWNRGNTPVPMLYDDVCHTYRIETGVFSFPL
jgi:hypothetical protein